MEMDSQLRTGPFVLLEHCKGVRFQLQTANKELRHLTELPAGIKLVEVAPPQTV